MIPNIIHNKENTHRYEHLLKQMETQGIGTFKFSPAIFLDCPKTSVMEAHKKVVRDNYDQPEIIIFEDDIVFTKPDSHDRFLGLYRDIPENVDIFLGSYYKHSKIRPVDEDFDELRWAFNGLHHYIIRKKFYDTFLSLPDGKHVDRAVGDTGAKIYVPKLLLSRQMGLKENGFSERRKTKNDYTSLEGKLKYY